MYVCMCVCVCMHACMHVRMYVCVYVCTYVCIYVCMYVGSQNQCANTMCIGEWQRPVLAPCAMWPSSARRAQTVMRADGLLQAFGELPRLHRKPGSSDERFLHGALIYSHTP